MLKLCHSQQLRPLSDPTSTSGTHASKSSPGRGAEWHYLTSNILQSTTLSLSQTAQNLDWSSPLQPLLSGPATDTLILDWSDTSGITKPTPGHVEINAGLGSNELVIHSLQNPHVSLSLNSLVKTDIIHSAISGQTILDSTELTIDFSHDPTGSSDFTLYFPSGPTTSYLPHPTILLVPSPSNWVPQSSPAQTSVDYSEDTQEIQDEASQSRPKNIGSYMTGTLKLTSNSVKSFRGFQSSQTMKEGPESSNLDFFKPNPTTISPLTDPTNKEPTTMTATKSTTEELTMGNTGASRALSSHTLGLILGTVSGGSLLVVTIFCLHRFCFKRARKSRKSMVLVTNPKADCAAAKNPHVSENMEVSRFSAYS